MFYNTYYSRHIFVYFIIELGKKIDENITSCFGERRCGKNSFHSQRLQMLFIFFYTNTYLEFPQVCVKGDHQEGDTLGVGDFMAFSDNNGRS